MTLGQTDLTLEATATDANGKELNGKAQLSYVGLPKIYVKQLGMPTNVSTDDGTTFSSSDGNVFDRSFSFTSTTGVKGSSIGSWNRTILVETLNDSTELVEAIFDEQWTIWTEQLPEGVESSKSGTKEVRVQYLRVVKPSAPEPEVTTLRMRAELDATVDGASYYNVYAERVTASGEVLKSWKVYVTGISFGTWRPNVTSQTVTSTAFTVQDGVSDIEQEATRYDCGDAKAFSVVNHSAKMYTFDVRFDAPADANGNTFRSVKGTINVWAYTVNFTEPETGETASFIFDGKAVTTKHEVTSSNLYTRTVVISCNGEVVDTQVGNVQLTVQ